MKDRAVSLPQVDSTGDLRKPLASSGSSDSLNNEPKQASKDGLARRSQNRVTERKRTEQERRQEQEKRRLKKIEDDKLRKEHESQLKHRRRAEIYALNAILRQLQQEKLAKFIAQQQQSGGGDQNAGVAPSIGV
ncbi:hypothetical protein Poli38472_004992 [Pythium oligandrum]|uniref:Uncharacterized protein n=1 Tax=Pythium oligandrum TaxID=41045 RepID=A0A8K1FIM9_PYTOL|nr:hypothetical protein Poli38472_004992 [Pythium oligandrum]|eukprot:TMW59923.1 hypothetical protein Poli38472_004992 [Pythium oligandrum]